MHWLEIGFCNTYAQEAVTNLTMEFIRPYRVARGILDDPRRCPYITVTSKIVRAFPVRNTPTP
jgi:hypothetical protein